MATTVAVSFRRFNILVPIALFAIVSLLRIGVGYQPHSGQDNYHGASSSNHTNSADHAYGGDYEAQRHWMELTLNLPISQWYYYDVQYWGLDYPPLTAYHSYLCGWVCRYVVNLPEAVELYTSRGYEDPLHKAYMRTTVLFSDLLFYATIVWVFATYQASSTEKPKSMSWIWAFIYPMIQPAIILIDHGHFQYNTVALGLSLWSFYFMTKPQTEVGSSVLSHMYNCMIASILFSCALSFKQMTLYYAPAVFCYLLGRCFEVDGRSPKGSKVFPRAMYRISLLGISVIASFIALWWPFVLYGPLGTSYMDRIRHMALRIIPLQRGLFEGKVSNLWCALSVKPFKIRERIPVHIQPVAALMLTFILILPSCYHLFRVGRGVSKVEKGQDLRIRDWTFDRHQLLWGTTNCALAFFLASFQVHEKSLLLALAPCSLLAFVNVGYWKDSDTTFVHWFSLVAVWTLWPLLQLDRLQVAYYCMIVIFCVMIGLQRELRTFIVNGETMNMPISYQGFFEQQISLYVNWMPHFSFVTMILLHLAEYFIVPPSHLPDLFPVLWSVVGCGFCVIAYCITCWHMFKHGWPFISSSAMVEPRYPVDHKQKMS
jgi:alpha-1,3-glucosyltransferase